MNFGCGTLITLLLLVLLAGKFIPHGPATPSQSTQSTAKAQAGGVVASKGKVIKSSPEVIGESHEPSFETMLSALKVWVDEKTKEAEQNVLARAALPAGVGPAAEVLAKVGEETKALVSQRVAEVTSLPVTSSQTVSPPKTQLKPAPGDTSSPRPVASPPSGKKLAVEGRDPVFNNPWNHAVEPVERYLKQHVHDAASIEVLEWGQVEVVHEGYQVRCVYKSKNVLGKMTTQSRLFVLDHAGKVVDIRD